MTATIEAEATDTEATESTDEAKTPGKRGRKAEPRDFSIWKEDHESFANYINERFDLGITPGQVKATFLLRGDWANTPERLAEREAAAKEAAEKKAEADKRKAEREAEKALEEKLSPEEKEKRKERNKVVKQAERAEKRAAELKAKAAELAAEAGFDLDGESNDEAPAEVAEDSVTVDAPDVAEEATEAPDEEKPRRPRKRPSA